MLFRSPGRAALLPFVALTLAACASAGTATQQQGAMIAARAERELVSRPISDLRYTVRFDSATAATRTLEVSLSFRPQPGSNDPVILALPRWTPGAYELGEFAQWVSGFSAEGGGRALAWDRVGPERWRIWPAGAGEVTVRFRYHADSLDNAMAWAQPDFAFFNGTNVFLYPVGQPLDRLAATLTVRTEPHWRVATGMTPAGAPRTWREVNYHDFVDMPVFVGRFDLDSLQVAERWTFLATYPEGALAGEQRAELWRQHVQMIPPMAEVFGELPYRSYWTMIAFVPGTGSALEHQNSHLGLYDPGFIGSVVLPSITAHEIFHLWNVKRLRPQEMVPYDYSRRQPTTLLWLSEGITDYYADVALVRGAIVDSSGFLDLLTEKMLEVEGTPPAALADVSVATWVGTPEGTRYLYYPKGALVGLLLDIAIRDASDGARSLDTVLRELYEQEYRRGSGVTDAEFWAAAERAAGRDLDEFRARWVAGRDPLPYDSILPLAGLRVRVDSSRVPLLGVTLYPDSLGLRVGAIALTGVADRAGIRPGDIIRSIGEVPAREVTPFIAEYQRRYADADGEVVPVILLRDGVERRLDVRLETSLQVVRRVDFDPQATGKAVRIRRALMGLE